MVVYAAVVWWPRVALKCAQRQLGRIQRLACLCITGALRSTPTAALEILLALPPLHVFVKMEAMASSYRLWVNKNWRRGIVGHKLIWTQMREISSVNIMRSDSIVPSFRFERDFETHFPSREEWLNSKLDLSQETLCFTDGSLMDVGQAGAGAFIVDQGVQLVIPLGTHATVFQAEVYAIMSCANSLLGDGYQGESITICSDSRAALLALGNPCIRSHLVLECADTLQQLAQGNSLQLLWVPAHCGIEGNEEADRLAREASSQPYLGPEPALGITPRAVRSGLYHWAVNQLQSKWSELQTCRQAHQLISGVHLQRTRQLMSFSRTKVRLLVGLLTGHNVLNRHLNIMGVTDDSVCPKCKREDETSVHFIGECDAYTEIRARTLGWRYLTTIEMKTLSLGDLLRFTKLSGRL